MRLVARLLIAGTLAAGCGEPEPEPGASGAREPTHSTATATATATATPREVGTKITVADSDFGRMLFDARRQAIYVFELDRKGVSVCSGECAAAWPPVYTDGDPVAGTGVDRDLLGTIERRDGRRQVTYAGRPLYFYVNEGPGEVRCHNVRLNGGLWWVVGPDGRRRPGLARAPGAQGPGELFNRHAGV